MQVYTGFIYEGPSIVKKINEAIVKEDAKVKGEKTCTPKKSFL